MKRRQETFRRASMVLFVLVQFRHGASRASPMEEPSEGNAVFSGPTEAHASSIYVSPAALLIAGPGQHLFVGGSLRLDTIGIDRSTVDLETGDLEDGPSMSATTWSPGMTLAYWLSVLRERAVFGISLHTPTWDRFLSGEPDVGYHVLGGNTYQAAISTAGGFRVGDWFILGVGLSLGYSGLDLDFARDTALEAGSDPERGIASDCGAGPCGAENPAAAEIYRLDVDSGGISGLFGVENIGASVGLAFQVKHDWWLTGSLVNPPGSLISLELGGAARVKAAPRDGGATHSGRAQITYRTPNIGWLGLRGPLLPGWDLVTSARWQNLSRQDVYDVRLYGGDFEEAGVPEWYPRYRGLRDVWQLSGGLEAHDTGQTTRLGGRVRIETGTTTDRTVSPLMVEGLGIGAAGGVEIRLSQGLVLQAGYDATWFPTVRSTDSAFDPVARVECVDSNYDFDECRAAREGRAIPTAAGSYRHLRHALTLSLRYDSL